MTLGCSVRVYGGLVTDLMMQGRVGVARDDGQIHVQGNAESAGQGCTSN